MPKPAKPLFLLFSQLCLGCLLVALVPVIWERLEIDPNKDYSNLYLPSFSLVLSDFLAPVGILFGLCAIVAAVLGNIYRQNREDMRAMDRRAARTLLGAFGVALLLLIFGDYFRAAPRSPVSRAKGDMRTLTIALETYYLDQNAYPAWTAHPDNNAFAGLKDKKGILKNMPTFTLQNGTALATLTTPLPYMDSYPADPFPDVKGATFCYWAPGGGSHASDANTSTGFGTGYILWSTGPDHRYDLTLENIARAYQPAFMVPNPFLLERTYDPSNGTGSAGDVYRYKQ